MRICRSSGVVAGLAACLLAACETTAPVKPPAPLVDPVIAAGGSGVVAARGVAGMVVADEPVAAGIGARILESGGSAADAAVATAAAMAVTLPSRVGLAAGGTCLVSTPSGGVEAVDFLARGFGRALVPGLAALAERYGKKPLATLVAPAVKLAHDGITIGSALGQDLASVDPILGQDPEASLLFAEGGRQKRAGATLVQPALAQALEAAAAAPDTSLARWVAPVAARTTAGTAFFAPADEAAGQDYATLWTIVSDVQPYAMLSWDERAHLMFEALRRSYAADGGSAQAAMSGYDPNLVTSTYGAGQGDTSFGATLVVLGFDGSAVACGFSLNGMFGTGRLDAATGSFEAAPSDPAVDAVAGVAIVLDPRTGELRAAAAGADFGAGLATVLAESLLAGRTTVQAIAYPRVAPDPGLDVTVVESRMDPGVTDRLALRGHTVRGSAGMGRVSIVTCEGSGAARGCVAATDPRGSGGAVAASGPGA